MQIMMKMNTLYQFLEDIGDEVDEIKGIIKDKNNNNDNKSVGES